MASATLTETGSVYRFRYATVPDYTDNGDGTADITINIFACRQDSDYPFYGRSLTYGIITGVTLIGFYPDDVPEGYGYENETMDDGEDYLVGYMIVRGTPNSSGNISCSIELTGGGRSYGSGWKYTTSYITSISGIYVATFSGYSWKSLGSGSASTSINYSLSDYQVGRYSFTPSSNGTLSVSTTGADDSYGGIGTSLSLASTETSGDSIVSGELVDNDDSNGYQFGCSYNVTANTRYYIFVHNYYGNADSGTLHISFTANKTITYYANGYGTAPAAQSVIAGNSITLQNKISNQTINSYTIIYYPNGGTSTPSAQTSTKTYNQTTWNTNSNGTGTNYTPGNSYVINNDLKLYAIWNGTQNSIRLANSITHDPDTLTRTIIFDSGEGLCSTNTLTSTATTTYNFTGWKVNNTGTALAAGSSYTPSVNTHMYASWSTSTSNYSSITLPYASMLNTETLTIIKLDANGGECEFKSFTVKGITSHIFEGWYYNNSKIGNGGDNYTPFTNITLTAKYSNQNTTYNSILLPTPYPRAGYTFKGWSTNKNATSGTTGYYIPSSDVTLYAIWEKDTYIYLSKNEKMKKAQPFIFYNGKWYKCQSWINKKSKWKETSG